MILYCFSRVSIRSTYSNNNNNNNIHTWRGTYLRFYSNVALNKMTMRTRFEHDIILYYVPHSGIPTHRETFSQRVSRIVKYMFLISPSLSLSLSPFRPCHPPLYNPWKTARVYRRIIVKTKSIKLQNIVI